MADLGMVVLGGGFFAICLVLVVFFQRLVEE